MERAERRAAGQVVVTPLPVPPPALRAREVDAPGGPVVVHESDDVDRDLNEAIARGGPTPYGRVLWPSAHACARVVLELAAKIGARTVLELGCGTGLVSLVAARAGLAAHATDVDDGALASVRASAAVARLDVATSRFDICSADRLPETATIVVAADLMYEELLAAALARRVREARDQGAWVVVGDPGRVFRARFDSLFTPKPEWLAPESEATGGVRVATLAPTEARGR